MTHAKEPGADDRFAPPMRRDRWLLGFTGVLAALFLLQLLDFGYGRDQGIYAVVADAVQRGEAPYRAAWDFKPPGIYLVFAVGEVLFGPEQRAVRILEALLLLSIFPAFGLFSRRAVGRWEPGALGAAMAVFAYVPLEYWNTAQPEGFGAALLAWALVFATQPPGRGATRNWRMAGALYGAAALLKPPLGGGIAVSIAWVAWQRWTSASNSAPEPARTRAWGALRPPLLAFSVGAAFPLLITLAYFALKGALSDLHQALFVFTPHYVALDFHPDRLPMLLGRAAWEWLMRMTPLNLMGIVPFVMLRPLHPGERSAALHVLGLILMAQLGVALQGKFFHYHFAATFVLTGLLAGWGYWKLWLLVREAWWSVAVAAVALVAVFATAAPGTGTLEEFWMRSAQRGWALGAPQGRQGIREHLYAEGDVDTPGNHRAAQWIEAHTPVNESIYIWGFQPVLYDLAKRRPASRYIYNLPQRAIWSRDAARGELLADLEMDPPAAIVVIHSDRAVFETVARTPVDSDHALMEFPELEAWIENHYRFAIRIGDLEIFTRRASES